MRASAALQASADVSRTMTCRRMPKRSVRPCAAAAALARRDLLGDVGRRLAPGQIDIDMLGRDRVAGAPTSRRNRAADRASDAADRAACPSRCEMRAGLGHLLALHQPAPDRQELVGDGIALVMVEEDAVALAAPPDRRR